MFFLAWASSSTPCKRYVVREYLRHRASSLAHVPQNFGSARIDGGTVQHLVRCTWMLCPSGPDTCGRLLVIHSAPTVDTAGHHCPSAAPVYAVHITRAAQGFGGHCCSVQLLFNACSLPRMAPFAPSCRNPCVRLSNCRVQACTHTAFGLEAVIYCAYHCLQAEQNTEAEAQPNHSNVMQQPAPSWSSMLFMPSGSCSTPAAGFKASATSPSASLPYPPMTFPSSLIPPKPDANGSALGIPVPVPARNTSACTLPPMPAVSPAVSAGGQKSAPQYRKVYVPSTVIHNGVAQQMLVPMMCMVAPMKQLPHNEQAPVTKLSGRLPPLPVKRKSASGLHQDSTDRKRACPSSPWASPDVDSPKQAHYRTRASSKSSPDETGNPDRTCDTGALSLLADAALMDL